MGETQVVVNGEMSAETITANPLDMSPEIFKQGLDRRKTNRDALMTWIRDALIENVDYGKIHIVSKSKCSKGKACTNKYHFAKPSLFKPGAEKICGMLGLTPRFPSLSEYEALILNGGTIKQIVLRCEMVTGNGQVVSEGVGARELKQDYGDLNKSLKMCLKSAQIDATLRSAGLSEIFTQDVEDMSFDHDEPQPIHPKKPVAETRQAKVEPMTELQEKEILKLKQHRMIEIKEAEQTNKWLLSKPSSAKADMMIQKMRKMIKEREAEVKVENTDHIQGLIDIACEEYKKSPADTVVALNTLIKAKYKTVLDKITPDQAKEIIDVVRLPF